jgi:hypothetical protein
VAAYLSETAHTPEFVEGGVAWLHRIRICNRTAADLEAEAGAFAAKPARARCRATDVLMALIENVLMS